jgi:hypothetical protein
MDMSNRPFSRGRLIAGYVLVAAGVAVSVLSVVAQERTAGTTQRPYKAPRTADGQPDLQGYWTSLTHTPLERPLALADKPFYTQQEAIDAFNKAANPDQELVHFVRSDFGATPAQTGARPNLRTSMIFDPPNGRLPPYTPGAQARLAARRAAQEAKGPNPLPQTWRDDRGSNWCVFMPNGTVPFTPDVYGSNYHIVQARDWIVIVYEWNTERRLIPLDNRPHGPASVRTYTGDSRAHWEGETLVIETVNFSPKRDFRGSPGTFALVERLTRTAEDMIDYTFTVTDPATWTTPWSAAIPMPRIKGPMFEYACNENNQDVFAALKNSRLMEQGKLLPAEAAKRGDPKAVVTERVREGGATVAGADDQVKQK